MPIKEILKADIPKADNSLTSQRQNQEDTLSEFFFHAKIKYFLKIPV